MSWRKGPELETFLWVKARVKITNCHWGTWIGTHPTNSVANPTHNYEHVLNHQAVLNRSKMIHWPRNYSHDWRKRSIHVSCDIFSPKKQNSSIDFSALIPTSKNVSSPILRSTFKQHFSLGRQINKSKQTMSSTSASQMTTHCHVGTLSRLTSYNPILSNQFRNPNCSRSKWNVEDIKPKSPTLVPKGPTGASMSNLFFPWIEKTTKSNKKLIFLTKK